MSDHHETLQSLEAEHTALQAEIAESLKHGKPTLETRRKLAEVAERLQAARSAASAQAAQEQAEIHVNAHAAGRTAAADAVAGIEASIGHLAAASAPNLDTAHLHPTHAIAIEQAAANLALAESRHAEAAQLHGNATREVADVERKLAEARTRHEMIVADRRSGKTSEAQEARLYALATDISDLQNMLTQVRATAEGLTPTLGARAVSDARQALDRALVEARATLLADHVALLTGALEKALYETEVAGRAVGKSLHMLWRPSPALRHGLQHGQMPAQQRTYGG
ncbi:hypothetical protein DyAD56_16265 [Dyella sp. AD56]|uniref:hypothetical protein n=1 Tax=Dyella sp. AD56 TaxID=1528744 RepID=UPI000CBC0CB0|nr:hypothetical protein [Dyella sp. AD56]PMQ04243.1 hypothetical protein DyAD56_16265 [Dyella sp. AD56]